jgi:hypothetical protein
VVLAHCLAQLEENGVLTTRVRRARVERRDHDDTLMNTAVRIKSRAIQRCGELLREIPATPGNHVPRLPGKSASTKQLGAAPLRVASPRQEAARSAGLSRDQAKQALRVAAVPAPLFEEMVERRQRGPAVNCAS